MATSTDKPGVAAPPPLLYGGAFVLVLVFRWFWPMPIFGHAVALWLGLALLVLGFGIAAWGIRTMQAAGTNVNPSAPHNRHRRIRSVSLLPQSSLPCPNAPLFRPHLGVQYVVGHCRAGPGPYHHASRSCPARGALPRAKIW